MKWWHHALIGTALALFITAALCVVIFVKPAPPAIAKSAPTPQQAAAPAPAQPIQRGSVVNEVPHAPPPSSPKPSLEETAVLMARIDYPNARGRDLATLASVYAAGLDRLDEWFVEDYARIADMACLAQDQLAKDGIHLNLAWVLKQTLYIGETWRHQTRECAEVMALVVFAGKQDHAR